MLQQVTRESGFAIYTMDQRSGRGRGARTWTSPAGSGIALSILIKPGPVREWSWLPLLLGVAATRVVRKRGLHASMKWPNDIVMTDGSLRKLGGILATVLADAVVVGIGLNTAMTVEQKPDERATSLAIEGFSGEIDPHLLVRELLNEFGEVLSAEDSRSEYRLMCSTLGLHVSVSRVDGSTLVGQAVTIADDGGLVVRTTHGDVTVHAGDVHHLR